MCGLVTAFNSRGVPENLFPQIIGDLKHRGPDAQDIAFREDRRLFLAHTRLKIIDTSESANQPFVSPCGRYTLVYNGEIYNYLQLKKELGEFWQWKTHSDTEVLLAAWVRWGADCLQRIVGMFAFAIHDAKRKCITLVRDRFGIKPLYYYSSKEHWAFASEIRPLFRFLTQVHADESTIRTYLQTGLYNHNQNTFFQNIVSVEPGTLINIDFNREKWRTKRWYTLSENIPDLSAANDEEIEGEVETRIEQAIKSHLVADVEVGLNVSGGVDSSMLVRVALEELDSVFLFNQDYEKYSELPWVKEIAEGGVLCVTKLDSDDIKQWLLTTVKSQTEPFGGITVCGYNSIYQLAMKNGVTVLLDGNGVDEVFLGYERYHQLYVYAADTEVEKNRRIKEFSTFWGREPFKGELGRAIDGTSGLRPDVISKRLRDFDLLPSINIQDFSDPVRQAAAEDLLYAKIPRGLRFNDRVSMAHSRELRVPFLDHRLVEYAFGIPKEKLFSNRGTKFVFRKLLAKRAPDSIAYAPKRSVQSPQREWMAKDWRPLITSILTSDSFRERGWVDVEQANSAYQAYLNGDNENSFFIWQWLNLELWAREFLN